MLESSTNEEPISVSAVYDNADHFCHILKEQANLFAESYQVLPTTDLTTPDEASYNERKKTIQPLLEKLHQYELIPEIFPLYDYSPENAPTLNLYLDALNHAIEKVRSCKSWILSSESSKEVNSQINTWKSALGMVSVSLPTTVIIRFYHYQIFLLENNIF